MKLKLLLLTMIFLHGINIYNNFKPLFKNELDVLIYDTNKTESSYIKNVFQQNGIQFQEVNKLDKNIDNLYLIYDSYNIALKDLPKYYIIFQNEDLTKKELTREYLNKISYSVAVWDYSWENINKYSNIVKNYYYFPENYEFADPIILPCLLPTKALNNYKEILNYSNANNNDISSHLPTIYCYSVLENLDLIVELGIRGAESTKAFRKFMDLKANASILGVDTDAGAGQSYSNIKNAQYYHMNDVDFPHYWKSTNPNTKPDLVFIDTSHYYAHTLDEISRFIPILSKNGCLLFHDSHMSPLANYTYTRLNNVLGGGGWDNQKGVIRAIKDYFSISFDETKYQQFDFIDDNITWRLIHYPFCNGLTLIKKIS